MLFHFLWPAPFNPLSVWREKIKGAQIPPGIPGGDPAPEWIFSSAGWKISRKEKSGGQETAKDLEEKGFPEVKQGDMDWRTIPYPGLSENHAGRRIRIFSLGKGSRLPSRGHRRHTQKNPGRLHKQRSPEPAGGVFSFSASWGPRVGGFTDAQVFPRDERSSPIKPVTNSSLRSCAPR